MRIFSRFRRKHSDRILRIVEHAHLLKRYILLICGVLLYAIAYNLFFLKNNIVYGGVAGIAIITKKLIDPTLMIVILTLILLIISFIALGKKESLKSLVGSLLYPLFIYLTRNIGDVFSISNDNLLLIAIIGGVCMGIGSGIVFKTGFTTGGTDILNQIFAKYFKVSIGTSMMFTDGLIVLAGGFFFGWTRVLYALIVLYIISLMVDKVVLGIASTKALYITTSEDEEIVDYLINSLNLGVTIIETVGGYSNKKRKMLMSVIPTSEYFRVKEGIHEIDENAVIVATDAYQAEGTYGRIRGVVSGIHKI
ncbi:MAG: YitT family protein [Tenericutes bacterium]|nr:YitT family protein [Mycoplasmatota bacterium]